MPGLIIAVRHDDVEEIATRFAHHVELARDLLQGLQRQKAKLEDDWLGASADAFNDEMDSKVVPSMIRLIGAFERAASTTRQIHKILHNAETEAAALFRVNGVAETGSGSAPSDGEPAGSEGQTRAGDGPTGEATGNMAVIRAVENGYARTAPAGTPFVVGVGDTVDISPNDVDQGGLGTCYLMSSLAAIAQGNPEIIRNMIRDNGDGSYTVTFKVPTWAGPHMYGIPDPTLQLDETYITKEVRVTPDFIADPATGQPLYAKYSGDTAGGKPEMWVPLIEKAYAQMNGGYAAVDGGQADEALASITGRRPTVFSPNLVDIHDLADMKAKGNAIVVDTHHYDTVTGAVVAIVNDSPVVSGHSYYVTKVDEAAGTVSVRNPWGWDRKEITMTKNQFDQIFADGQFSPTK